MKRQREPRELPLRQHGIDQIRFSPDGQLLAASNNLVGFSYRRALGMSFVSSRPQGLSLLAKGRVFPGGQDHWPLFYGAFTSTAAKSRVPRSGDPLSAFFERGRSQAYPGHSMSIRCTRSACAKVFAASKNACSGFRGDHLGGRGDSIYSMTLSSVADSGGSARPSPAAP